MNYKPSSVPEIVEMIYNGWFPVWFAREDDKILIDLCCNYRLADGKISFLSVVEYTPSFTLLLCEKMKSLWIEEADRCLERC